ncbi:MAG: hypothetical protein HYR58_04210 [Acidobacteria bacterium]|nr:hypothetical protein [Acidobacteriota bacterium]MBI3484153.1 hypothetical protein [Acidobacteriota bacterium]
MAAHSQCEFGKLAAQTIARAASLGLSLFLLVFSLHAQSAPETVGRIEGDDLAIRGQVSLLREGGQSAAELVSGAEVTVRTGLARITLADGGEVDICGPAQFTVLKSGGSLTLALNQGRAHVRIGNTPMVTIYTAAVVASLISVGEGPRDATIGVEADGSLRVVAAHGAVRLEQQLTGQSLVVPQSSEVALPGGQLESLREARGECRCEPVFARAAPPAPTPVQVAALASSVGDAAKPDAAKKDPPKPATEEPKWTVVMPPLMFDATKPPPALEPRPETILLVREVRVQPAVVFTGRVEKPPKIKAAKKRKEAAATTETSASVVASAEGAKVESAPVTEKKSGGGFGSKLRNFFRRLFGGKPKS